jgi:two-component system, LytTR family, sensor histidine kinase AlgZ
MNTIAGLCRSDPARAEQITLDLADLFRATFATGPNHTLAEELELARAYLDIEQTRFGERLMLEWDVPPTQELRLQVPALVLLPLVENAIQHGVAPSRTDGRVSVRVWREHHKIMIEIGNTLADQPGTGTNTAGEEARARLRQCFGERARIETHREDGRFLARVQLPTRTPHARKMP